MFTGATACGSGYICTEYNAYFYQCVPGATTSTTSASTSSSTTNTSASPTSIPHTTSISITPTSTPTTPSSTVTSPSIPTTLVSGYSWIRAVATLYYHSYLQTLPTATPGAALLDAPTTAGQFAIAGGQLVYYTGAGAAPLYMWVEDAADKTQRALATWFNGTASSYGSFAFSGDTVTWTDPDVARPNTAAFYVCPTAAGANALFVNTGAYLYLTPSGCFDVDVSFYPWRGGFGVGRSWQMGDGGLTEVADSFLRWLNCCRVSMFVRYVSRWLGKRRAVDALKFSAVGGYLSNKNLHYPQSL